jgi:hypothetical protein
MALSKAKLIETIKDLPDRFSVEDLFERIILLQKIDIGLSQSKSGQVLSTSEARKKVKKWLSK